MKLKLSKNNAKEIEEDWNIITPKIFCQHRIPKFDFCGIDPLNRECSKKICSKIILYDYKYNNYNIA